MLVRSLSAKNTKSLARDLFATFALVMTSLSIRTGGVICP